MIRFFFVFAEDQTVRNAWKFFTMEMKRRLLPEEGDATFFAFLSKPVFFAQPLGSYSLSYSPVSRKTSPLCILRFPELIFLP